MQASKLKMVNNSSNGEVIWQQTVEAHQFNQCWLAFSGQIVNSTCDTLRYFISLLSSPHQTLSSKSSDCHISLSYKSSKLLKMFLLLFFIMHIDRHGAYMLSQGTYIVIHKKPSTSNGYLKIRIDHSVL